MWQKALLSFLLNCVSIVDINKWKKKIGKKFIKNKKDVFESQKHYTFFFYKQPPYKQLALEASKWQATFRAILFELSNFLKYENCLLHIIDILIKRKMNEQHLYYAKQHRNGNCVIVYVKAFHQIPPFTWCGDSIQRSI